MKFVWAGLAAIALIAGVVYFETRGSPPAPAAAQPSVLVSTTMLITDTLPATTAAYGSIAAGTGAETDISLRASGIVSAVDVVPGQGVAAGGVLAVITPDAQSIADLQKARGAVAAGRIARAHVAALLSTHLATVADLAVAAQNLRDAEGALRALQANGTGVPRTVRAPDAAIVASVPAVAGSDLLAGAVLVRLVRPGGLVAQVGVTPLQAAAIKMGDPAQVSLLDTGQTLSGSVTMTGVTLDPQTGLQPVFLSLRGQNSVGMAVRAVITIGTWRGYVVPRDSVQTDQQGDYGFQLDSQGIARRVTVQVRGQAGDKTVIAADLNAAMPYVTAGAYQLSDGMAARTAH